MLVELKAALRFLATQETVFTVLTGTGRFFSSGLDVKRGIPTAPEGATDAEKKVFYAAYVADAIDLMVGFHGSSELGGRNRATELNRRPS